MAALLDIIRNLLNEALEGQDPPAPTILADIQGLKDKLSSINIGTDGNGPVDWIAALRRTIDDPALRETLLVRAVQLNAPRLAETLVLAGLVDIEWDVGADHPQAFRLKWDKLKDYMTRPGDASLTALLTRVQDIDDVKIVQVLIGLLVFSPHDLLVKEYAKRGFAALPDPEPAAAVDLLDLVNKLINSPLKLGVPVAIPVDPGNLKALADAGRPLATDYLAILGTDVLGASPLDGVGVELKLKTPNVFAKDFIDLGGGLKLVAATGDNVEQTYRLVMKNGTFDTAAASTGALETGFRFEPPGGRTVLGNDPGTRIEVGPGSLMLRFSPQSPLFTLKAALDELAFVLSSEPLGILSSIVSVPPELKFRTSVSMSYAQGVGLQLSGDASGALTLATEFNAPMDLAIGSSAAGLKIDRVRIRVEASVGPDGPEARVILSFGATGAFGPMKIAADGMGGWFGQWQGKRGGIDLPTGIALSLDAGPVAGGGFLAALQSGDYAGGLEIKVLGIGVAAFALYGQADGAPAFVGILGIRLPFPGIQISFGFSVTGIGGVIGINRRADTDVLREQIATGASGQILFCENPTGSALTVIAQAQRMFPKAKGIFLIGPTLQISWLELIRIDAGIFIELPGPRQIFIAGSARFVIGTDDAALIYLRMDFIGGIDLTKSLIYFDAALVNSSVMQVFKITGGVALRIAYGENGYFLFSVGGFHPSFNPGGLELPKLARAGTAVSIDIAWLKLENYFALTSNTLQIGASVEAGIDIGVIAAHGWLRFDALVQFDPFHFVAEIDAGFEVEVSGVSFCNVRVQGQLSGPGPLVVSARASVKLLFVRVSAHVTFALGSDSGPGTPAIADVLTLLKAEFAKLENIRAEGEDTSVVLRDNRESAVDGAKVVGAVGAIVLEQKRAPLGHDLERFEGRPLDHVHHLELSAEPGMAFTPETDWFGLGTFLNVSSSEALNNGRFINGQSGIRIPLGAPARGNTKQCDVNLELVKLPAPSRVIAFTRAYLHGGLAVMQAERGINPTVQSGGARIKTGQEEWAVHRPGGDVSSVVNASQAFALARRSDGTAAPSAVSFVDLSGVF